MKTFKLIATCIVVLTILLASCEKNDIVPGGDAVQLPPYETMAMDFSDFEGNTPTGKSAVGLADKAPNGNWLFSRIVVGYWNTALFTTLAVPVASFKAAFSHQAEPIGDNIWEWSYSVDGFSSEYNARLTGELTGDVVLWTMYVSKQGTDPFDEFIWFTGESRRDGSEGHWILNQGHDRPNAMLRIDWERSGPEVGAIRYTWVRELNDNDEADPYRESYLQYGLQQTDFDAYFDAHVYEPDMQGFVDVRIEWSRNTYNGRVRAFYVFEDEDWHCWDPTGEDMLCE